MPKSVCVVGAGLAGGFVASRLAKAGHRVTLIEQGESPAPSVPADETWAGDDLKSVFTRGEGIGGSSNFWHGGLIALDATDIEGKAPQGGGPRFPISYAELCRYYRQALEQMTGGAISLEELQADGVADPGVPLDQKDFRLKPMVFPPRPYSTQAMIIEAERTHGLKVVRRFRVERLIFAGGSRVTAVEGFVHGTASPTRIEADVVVLCAGGIGSPKILLRSAAEAAALRALPIGRSLIDHPTGFVFKARLRTRLDLQRLFGKAHDRVRSFRKRLGLVLRPGSLSLAAGRNHVLYLRPAFSMKDPQAYNELKSRLVAHRGKGISIADLFGLLRHWDLLAEAINFKFGLLSRVKHVAGFVFAEQLELGDNAISLDGDGRFRIKWEVSAADAKSLEEFLRACVKSQEGLFEEVVFFPGLLGSGAHHSGGCRMSSSASHGVVGADLRVFGVENLFVADGSVIGYSGHANTGLTIAALGLKCADEVSARLA